MADEQPTMAVFASIDDKPGFEMLPCTEATLWAAVRKAMFCCEDGDPISDQHRSEIDGAVEALQQDGHISFEDGWLALRIGLAQVGTFAIHKARDIAEDRDFEDGRRYKQHLRAEAAEERYRLLREALIDALGPQADSLITAIVTP